MRPRISGVKTKFSDGMIQLPPQPPKPAVAEPKETKMSETATDTESMNGSEEMTVVAEKGSPLDPLRQAFAAAGGKPPTPEEGEKLKAAYKKAKSDVVAADAAASGARERLSNVCKAIMERTGARTIEIDGVDHIPSVHGKSYFYRTPGNREKKERFSL